MVDPLQVSAPGIPVTTRGIGPQSRHRTAVQSSPTARRWWLVIGVLLVAGAAVALGLVAIGS
ncbi:MAG TPA: hypothetical protein VGD80_15320 [Kofleriaceae bacterium]